MTRRHSGMLIASLALSLLTACSVAKETSSSSITKDTGGSSNAAKATGGQPANSGAGTGQSSSAPDPAASPAGDGASQIGIDQPDPSKVIYSKQFGLPGNPQRKVTVGILSLQRKDRVAILRLVLTPEFADLPASELIGFQKALAESDVFKWAPTLLDLKNLKKYKVLHAPGLDGSGMLLFDQGEAASGQPIYGWAVFAAPPAGVTSLDLNVTEWMPRITNVPIT